MSYRPPENRPIMDLKLGPHSLLFRELTGSLIFRIHNHGTSVIVISVIWSILLYMLELVFLYYDPLSKYEQLLKRVLSCIFTDSNGCHTSVLLYIGSIFQSFIQDIIV